MFRKLTLTFGSKTKAQEIILLLNNQKEVVRQGFYPHEFNKVRKFCQEKNLYYSKSRFKVLLQGDGIYSNKSLRIPEEDKREGMHFFYFSKDEEKTLLANYYELVNNHKGLGLILGYPSCCVDYFIKSFSKNNPNPKHQPTNRWTNISKRNEDNVLLSHFPCSSECSESIGIAQNYLKSISEIDRERAEELYQSLNNSPL